MPQTNAPRHADAPDVFKVWLPLGIEILGEPAFIEVMVG